jgi:hypothetical protein
MRVAFHWSKMPEDCCKFGSLFHQHFTHTAELNCCDQQIAVAFHLKEWIEICAMLGTMPRDVNCASSLMFGCASASALAVTA